MNRFPPILLAILGISAALPAQARRTWAEVTPEGVFVREATGRGSLGPIYVGNPNPSPMGLRWTYANPPGVPWITQSVSVGMSGAFAWLGQNLNGERLSFVSTTDDAGPPPLPVYEIPLLGADFVEVKAADDGPACALAVVQPSTGVSPNELRLLEGFSTTPVFTVSGLPNFEVAVSDDGRFVAAAYSPSMGVARVDVFDANAPSPTVPVAMLTSTVQSFREHDISGDGSTVLLATHMSNHVFDVATGNEIFTDSTTVSHDAHSIDFDGDTWARGGFNPVRAWIHNGATYQAVLNFSDPTLGFPVYTACDVSADGSTLVAAAYDANNNSLFRVYCFDLDLAGSTTLWTYVNNGSGGLQDTPQAVSLSDDGRWIAVGSWGAEFSGHPEALLFDRNAGPVPIGSVDTPGSVFDVDLSGDGQFLVVGTKAVHANVFGNGGEGYSFDRGGQGHRLVGTASVGRSIALETGGTPGDSVILAVATALGTPTTIPPIGGSLLLDLASLVFPPQLVGTVPAGGVLSTPLAIPNVPSSVGLVFYTQTLRVGTGVEFDNALVVPITP
jgi:hypothetical protein